MATYEQLTLKDYRYWTLILSDRQYYLGRAYIWLKRPGEMQWLSALNREERAQLFELIIPEYETAAKTLFSPDHMNYALLGNEFANHKGHGHMHLIPRYAGRREFRDVAFIDQNWGKNYTPYPKPLYPDELLFAIRDALRKELTD